MDKLQNILSTLKEMGCSGIKVSFEDEGALYNEIITMRSLTANVGLGLSVKIGGCEAKRDIIDCIDLNCDTIVAPMVESKFALNKFLKSLDAYNYKKQKGFNLETIQSYNNLEELSELLNKVDFVTVGRVDFVGSLNKDRDFVDTDDMYTIVENVFKKAREQGTKCYMGGAVSINSKDFIEKLIEQNLLDKFETRYIIYDVHSLDIKNLDKLLYWANVFEVEWLKFIHQRYSMHANKDVKRIKMIEDRIAMNNIEN
jgi:2-keto-3-deoxy-L-rhamnonate aldolase RhmA